MKIITAYLQELFFKVLRAFGPAVVEGHKKHLARVKK